MPTINITELDKGVITDYPSTKVGNPVGSTNIVFQNGQCFSRSGISILYTLEGIEGTPLTVVEYVDLKGVIKIFLFTSLYIYSRVSDTWVNVSPLKDGILNKFNNSESFSFATINNYLYASDGVSTIVKYIEGDYFTFSSCPYFAKYIIEYRNQLLLLNTTEGGNEIPFRVRWSDIGKPEIWDSGKASFIDLVLRETPIIGITIHKYNAFIYKQDCIIQMRWQGQPSLYTFDEDYVIGTGLFAPNTLCSYKEMDILHNGSEVISIEQGKVTVLNDGNRKVIYGTSKMSAYINEDTYFIRLESGLIWGCNLLTGSWGKYNYCSYRLESKKIKDLVGKIKDQVGTIKQLSAPSLVPYTIIVNGNATLLGEGSLLIIDAIGNIEDAIGNIWEPNAIMKPYILLVTPKCILQMDKVSGMDTFIDDLGEAQKIQFDSTYETADLEVTLGEVIEWRKLWIEATGLSVRIEYSIDSGSSWKFLKEITLNPIFQTYYTSVLKASKLIRFRLSSKSYFRISQMSVEYDLRKVVK